MPALHWRFDGLWIDGLDFPASMEPRVTAIWLRFDGVWLDLLTGNRTNLSVVGGSISSNPSRHCHMNNRSACVFICSWVWTTVQIQRAIGENLVLRRPPLVHEQKILDLDSLTLTCLHKQRRSKGVAEGCTVISLNASVQFLV